MRSTDRAFSLETQQGLFILTWTKSSESADQELRVYTITRGPLVRLPERMVQPKLYQRCIVRPQLCFLVVRDVDGFENKEMGGLLATRILEVPYGV